MHPFSQIGLDNWILKVCDQIGYQNPTSIQELGIPAILKGQNVIANAQTGSGKTATFAFPILQTLSKDPYGIYALVLTANRELAMQINEQFCIFGAGINLRNCCITGGSDMSKQLSQISQIPHIIIATPGRLIDLIEKSQTLREYLLNVKYLVLDEADRLFEQTILPDIQQIISYLPKEQQIILATATINENFNDDYISQLIDQKIKLEQFSLNNQKKVVQTLKQKYVLMPSVVKDFYFVHLMRKYSGISCIVFVNRCRQCHIVQQLLKELKMEATCLHSMLKQGQRIANLKNFRNSQYNILVATDVASRGLDIHVVDLVINYDLPRNADDYIHRVGRTARKGKRGLAISLVTQSDVGLVLNIEQQIGDKLETLDLLEKEVLENMSEVTKAQQLVQLKMSESGAEDEFEQAENSKQEYQEQIKQNQLIKKAKDEENTKNSVKN